LGVDVGTLGTKTVVFDAEGHLLGSSSREYGIEIPRPAWAEQDPETWWRAVVETVRVALQKAGVSPGDVRGIGLSVLTPALVPVDRMGRALRRAILMIDQRAVREAGWIEKQIGADRLFEVTGNRAASGAYSAPGMLWIRREEPRVFEETFRFLHADGYIVHRMTGEFSMDYTQASASLLFETGGRKMWSGELCAELGIPPEKLPEVHPSWEVVGELVPEAAGELGLPPGVPVVAGANDTACACVGTGVVEADMTLLSVGTTVTLSHVTDESAFDVRLVNRAHAVPDRWIIMGAMSTPGAAYRWLRDHLYSPGQEGAADAGATYSLMDSEAEESPPGANGLIFLPYLSGERTPIWNPHARGLLFGLTLSHTRADILRAFLEGGAYCVRDNLEVLRSRGLKVEEVRIGGGGAKSRLWRQIMADVLGVPLSLPRVTEAAALGAAILAGTGAKVYGDPASAARRLVEVRRAERPRELHRRYEGYYWLFKKLYDRVRECYEDLRRLEG